MEDIVAKQPRQLVIGRNQRQREVQISHLAGYEAQSDEQTVTVIIEPIITPNFNVNHARLVIDEIIRADQRPQMVSKSRGI